MLSTQLSQLDLVYDYDYNALFCPFSIFKNCYSTFFSLSCLCPPCRHSMVVSHFSGLAFLQSTRHLFHWEIQRLLDDFWRFSAHGKGPTKGGMPCRHICCRQADLFEGASLTIEPPTTDSVQWLHPRMYFVGMFCVGIKVIVIIRDAPKQQSCSFLHCSKLQNLWWPNKCRRNSLNFLPNVQKGSYQASYSKWRSKCQNIGGFAGFFVPKWLVPLFAQSRQVKRKGRQKE